MRYSEFVVKWSNDDFTLLIDPIKGFVDRLKPENERRWKRLELMAEALGDLRKECEKLLTLKAT